jgi:phage recombination protein Bet
MGDLAELKPEKSLVRKFADRFGVEPDKMISTLKQTCFNVKKGPPVTNEQMMALLVVADQHQLNPWTKEIFAFPDGDSIIPVVSVDGWARIINGHPEFDGMEFRYSDSMIEKGELDGLKHAVNEWCECVIYRKDRDHPIAVREYLTEVYRPPMGKYKTAGPWQSHTRRMLRHKTLIQAARIAFSFSGIYDEDEAGRIIEAEVVRSEKPTTTVSEILAEEKPVVEFVDDDEPEGDESGNEDWEQEYIKAKEEEDAKD